MTAADMIDDMANRKQFREALLVFAVRVSDDRLADDLTDVAHDSKAVAVRAAVFGPVKRAVRDR